MGWRAERDHIISFYLNRWVYTKMKENHLIEITFRNGKSVVWDANNGAWDDYSMKTDGRVFIIWRGENKVAFYNMDDITSVVVK